VQHQHQLVKVTTVASILDVCKATVWAHAAKYPDFPQPIKMATRMTRWKLSDITDYIESKAAVKH
jgi:predicted DNA-binding transcriptional regulator AlpA